MPAQPIAALPDLGRPALHCCTGRPPSWRCMAKCHAQQSAECGTTATAQQRPSCTEGCSHAAGIGSAGGHARVKAPCMQASLRLSPGQETAILEAAALFLEERQRLDGEQQALLLEIQACPAPHELSATSGATDNTQAEHKSCRAAATTRCLSGAGLQRGCLCWCSAPSLLLSTGSRVLAAPCA